MRNCMIFAGAAALAITAPALAKPGGGQGGGSAKAERGGGGGGGGQAKAMRGGDSAIKMRGPEQRQGKAERRAERQKFRDDRGDRGSARQQQRLARDRERQEQRVARKQERQQERAFDKRSERRDIRVAQDRGRGNADRRIDDFSRTDGRVYRSDQQYASFASPTLRTTGLIDGCPPGLAAKGNGCLPPGQARKLVGAAIPAALGTALLPPLYRSWYPDNDEYYYRTADGYVYRVDRDRNLVDSYWPIADEWNGAYYVGAAYPQDYLGYYNVPVQYQPYYTDSDDAYYRYGDGSIYEVDPGNGLIESIVSLLAGGTAVGQPLPAGYDIYNVPYAYRDRYVDTPDAWYRYNDGNIYQVDPTTRIIQAIVETLV